MNNEKLKSIDVMTKDPLCCQPADTAARAAQVMKALDVGPIPVVENAQTKKLIGIVTDRDLALKVVAEELNPLTVKIEDVMTRQPVTVRADDSLDEVVDLMAKNQLRRLPVIDKDGAIIGIIAQADVATRTAGFEKTGHVVEQISKPSSTRGRSLSA